MSEKNILEILKKNGFEKIKNQLPGRGDVYRDREGFVVSLYNDNISISSPFVEEATAKMKPQKGFDLVQRQEEIKEGSSVKIGFNGVVTAEMKIDGASSTKKRFDNSEAFVRNSYAFFDNMDDDTEI